jgi:uncharacterized damage-inducible protein DinB
MKILERVLVATPPFAKPVKILQDLPFEWASIRPTGFPHSLYEELWHLNFWLHFSLALMSGKNPEIPKHSSDSFPTDNDNLGESTWDTLLAQVHEGLKATLLLAQNETELDREFRPDRTVRDELIVVASHNAYHFGRIVTLRQVLGIWSPDLGENW